VGQGKGKPRDTVKGAKLEPIRVVRRELRRPDGTVVQVDVPVYPPFRLEDRSERSTSARRRPPKDSKRKTG
jgi:hypothetical protein